MSRASEWANRVGDARANLDHLVRDEAPACYLPFRDSPIAYANLQGMVVFDSLSGTIQPEHACTLARWILDTFDESK